MFKNFKIFQKKNQKQIDKDINSFKKDAQEVCSRLFDGKLSHLKLKNYKYDTTEAVLELGLEREMIEQLVDDYVAQVIKATVQFDLYMETLRDSKNHDLEPDYTLFRDLAHKNLGVARNLRIKDAEILLYELMKKDDLDYLLTCLKALKVCAIKLRPESAYNIINSF